jgi:hypothetical protein
VVPSAAAFSFELFFRDSTQGDGKAKSLAKQPQFVDSGAERLEEQLGLKMVETKGPESSWSATSSGLRRTELSTSNWATM